ncbi:tRNA pseudouridine(13) synthase TruD [Dasania sp. GY-MA-18]|uniref:tRNA pseudouridine synthase D n=1 Tax=Dasania phycosphaerae TaxID=2950436 RepID=A0A9J6RPZ9_9GAMM|nr:MULTISPECIES: tRNA pseudouridine(13) synthase TruD [Dasania]MCR8923992.1 tRNA pseudouridine(13) synthase TruD [Dasania sp. GY-MA-18]MCZ0866426.1 tRNA pseudouridine(13) synthase TruD [Dasania phycosphaerae]MCZ0870150.1 tRNA pseudouridine(13) synthase TruD [Dasania phycosphaerae]
MSDYLSLLSEQHKAYAAPTLSGVLRSSPQDFFVDEILGFEPEGEGEHVFIYIEKTAANTQFVAEQLATFAKVAVKNVSFSGMKDRWAVTRQWFSVQMPGKQAPDFSALNNAEIQVLKQSRHPRKLRRGVHKANYFRLRLRQLSGDRAYLDERVTAIAKLGVPNYFGEQRFGHGARNLSSAQRWFAGAFKPRRNQQGLFLSAARSLLFNQLLSKRVADNNWADYIPGDIMMLAGTHSVFKPEPSEAEDIRLRLQQGDIHSTGPMFGKALAMCCSEQAVALEQLVFEQHPELCAGLLKQGLTAERRALRVIPAQLQHQFIDEDTLELSFELPSGCFATAVMAELVDYHSAERERDQ